MHDSVSRSPVDQATEPDSPLSAAAASTPSALPSRDQLARWDREIVWHAFTQMSEYEPLIIERAQGATLVDVDGREYLDAVASVWCNVHGHRHPTIDAAIRRAARPRGPRHLARSVESYHHPPR